ncbi:MAG: MogA/MoaB family molybdenum cofactor biosynthesis protein, partial [Nitriliruptoraceae bacterium]
PASRSERVADTPKHHDARSGPGDHDRAPWTAAVVTASDGVSAGERSDRSGPAVVAQLVAAGFAVPTVEVVPDERSVIADTLRWLADEEGFAVVAITGGTGFGPRDVTPEATLDVIDRAAPGLAEAMRAAGRQHTPMADLSRGVCGLRGSTLLLDLPGSPKGATESLEAVLGLLPHALDLLAGDTAHVPGPPTD